MKSLTLEVVTQERHLLTETITQVTIMTQTGQITVLPHHLPLFARLAPGELSYQTTSGKHHLAVTGGFVDVSPNNIVTILADTAVRSEEINLQEAQKAVESARKALEEADDEKTTLKIETELRNALLRTKIAKKRQSSAS